MRYIVIKLGVQQAYMKVEIAINWNNSLHTVDTLFITGCVEISLDNLFSKSQSCWWGY
jgi:hypothetical protein